MFYLGCGIFTIILVLTIVLVQSIKATITNNDSYINTGLTKQLLIAGSPTAFFTHNMFDNIRKMSTDI